VWSGRVGYVDCQFSKRITIAVPEVPTGMKKKCRKGLFLQAVRKQQRDMVASAAIKRMAAALAAGSGMGWALMVTAKRIFNRPIPKNAMWPRRVMRLRKEL
jgi:hypothetical protein